MAEDMLIRATPAETLRRHAKNSREDAQDLRRQASALTQHAEEALNAATAAEKKAVDFDRAADQLDPPKAEAA